MTLLAENPGLHEVAVFSFRFALDPAEPGSQLLDGRLHCQDGAKSGLALRNPVVGL